MEVEGALRGMRFEEGGLVVDFVGDRGLIVGRRLLPLVCHRRDRGDYDKQRGAVMAAAREGAVIVSAFISEWERVFLTELMCERLPVVRIVANGLNDRYKPSGLNFYAVAEKRMGVVSPWVYRFERRGSVSRERCLIMNELARVIAGRGDEWWKGRGGGLKRRGGREEGGAVAPFVIWGAREGKLKKEGTGREGGGGF